MKFIFPSTENRFINARRPKPSYNINVMTFKNEKLCIYTERFPTVWSILKYKRQLSNITDQTNCKPLLIVFSTCFQCSRRKLYQGFRNGSLQRPCGKIASTWGLNPIKEISHLLPIVSKSFWLSSLMLPPVWSEDSLMRYAFFLCHF